MSNPKRQHPMMILTGVIAQLKGLIWPIVLVLLARTLGSNPDEPFFDRFTLIITGVTLGGTLLFSVLRWLFFTYRYDHDIIEIKSGVFIKKERKIKRERIQAISLDTHVILKYLGLTSLNVETAGNLNEAEVKINVLTLLEATQLKQTLQHNGQPTEDAPSAPPNMVEVDTNTLFLAGLTSGGVGVMSLGVLFFGFQIFGIIDAVTVDFTATWQLVLAAMIALFLVLLLGWILSIIKYVLQYAAFTLQRENQELTITRGLIRKKEVVLSLDRVQAIQLIQGLIRQPLGYLTIEAKVAGARSDDAVSATVLHPLIHEREVPAFMASLFPQYVLPQTMTSSPKRARVRYLFRASWLYIVLTPLYFFVPQALFILLLWLPSVALAVLKHRAAAVSLSEDQLTLRYRNVAKSTLLVPRHHIQALTFQANPLQRWRKLKDVGLYVLSAPSPTYASVRDLELSVTDGLYEAFAHRKEADPLKTEAST